MYIHELDDWPRFRWDAQQISQPLGEVRHRQGRLAGRMEALGFRLRQEAVLETVTADVIKTSEIEGEVLDQAQVRSSVARRLGMEIGALTPADRRVEGVVEMMIDATGRYEEALDEERLFAWHSALFPSGRSGMRMIRVGVWRDDGAGPMQVVSGPVGRERIHYEAPAAARLPREMAAFLAWFNRPAETDEVLKSAIAHLWFVTLHPFDDGNGRMARAVADMLLGRSEKSAQRFYSLSTQIGRERAAYYDILERTQKGTMDVTPWLVWVLTCLGRAIDNAESLLSSVLARARFWEGVREASLNDRQKLVCSRLLEGFEGKLTTTKYAKLAKCSQDTALRDILSLLRQGILVRGPAGGRSTSYALVHH